MDEVLSNALNTTLQSFDFAFCITANVLTYLIVKTLSVYKPKVVGTPTKKRVILLLSVIVIAAVYYVCKVNIQLIINSAILAPVSWSWLFKPIVAHFNLDYNKIDEVLL